MFTMPQSTRALLGTATCPHRERAGSRGESPFVGKTPGLLAQLNVLDTSVMNKKSSPSPMAALLQLESSQHNASDCESALRELASRMMKIIFLGGYLHNSSAGMRQRRLPPQRPSKRTAVSFSTSQRRDRGGLKPHFLEVLPGHRGNLMRGMSILLCCRKSGAPPNPGKTNRCL